MRRTVGERKSANWAMLRHVLLIDIDRAQGCGSTGVEKCIQDIPFEQQHGRSAISDHTTAAECHNATDFCYS